MKVIRKAGSMINRAIFFMKRSHSLFETMIRSGKSSDFRTKTVYSSSSDRRQCVWATMLRLLRSVRRTHGIL
ncbi:MAG TPA: hypothetical protein DDZ51_25500 [Planctomycetaceae bacterium]|nr:hypothetical protein [Planctomycetaceae bacterium]